MYTNRSMGKQVGQFIRGLREKRGLSQGDVAKLLHLKTAQSISNIERGVSPLPRAKIKKLADVLGVKQGEIDTILLGEINDRYSKAAGVTSRSLAVANDLSTDEFQMIRLLAEKFKAAKTTERASLKKLVKKVLAS